MQFSGDPEFLIGLKTTLAACGNVSCLKPGSFEMPKLKVKGLKLINSSFVRPLPKNTLLSSVVRHKHVNHKNGKKGMNQFCPIC